MNGLSYIIKEIYGIERKEGEEENKPADEFDDDDDEETSCVVGLLFRKKEVKETRPDVF